MIGRRILSRLWGFAEWETDRAQPKHNKENWEFIAKEPGGGSVDGKLVRGSLRVMGVLATLTR